LDYFASSVENSGEALVISFVGSNIKIECGHGGWKEQPLFIIVRAAELRGGAEGVLAVQSGQ
jgi:hypothetical protein